MDGGFELVMRVMQLDLGGDMGNVWWYIDDFLFVHYFNVERIT